MLVSLNVVTYGAAWLERLCILKRILKLSPDFFHV